jgi:hypothetical protein
MLPLHRNIPDLIGGARGKMDDTHPFQVIHHLLEKIAVGLSPPLEFGVSLVPESRVRRRKCLHFITSAIKYSHTGDFMIYGMHGKD